MSFSAIVEGVTAPPKIVNVSAGLLCDFPALADAVQPPHGPQRFDIFVGSSLVEPNPPRAGSWIGPILSDGDCLEPLVPNGRQRWRVDPSQQPRYGDFVLVKAGPQTLHELAVIAEQDAAWCEKYPTLPDCWFKQFQLTPDGPILVEKSSAIPLFDNHILGVAHVQT